MEQKVKNNCLGPQENQRILIEHWFSAFCVISEQIEQALLQQISRLYRIEIEFASLCSKLGCIENSLGEQYCFQLDCVGVLEFASNSRGWQTILSFNFALSTNSHMSTFDLFLYFGKCKWNKKKIYKNECVTYWSKILSFIGFSNNIFVIWKRLQILHIVVSFFFQLFFVLREMNLENKFFDWRVQSEFVFIAFSCIFFLSPHLLQITVRSFSSKIRACGHFHNSTPENWNAKPIIWGNTHSQTIEVRFTSDECQRD